MSVIAKAHAPRARLNCEQLEARENPAGNVTAFFNAAGQLFVIGDGFDNQVSTQIDSAGNLVVIGVNGTTVNGQPLVRFGPFVPTDVIIDGGFGNDQLDVGGIFINNSLQIGGGAGNDLVIVRGTNMARLFVDTNVGNDLLITNNSAIRVVARLHGGPGFDTWDFNNIFVGGFLFHDGFERIV
jgi:hypothetical protein